MERFFVYLRKTLVATMVLVFTFVVTYTPQPYTEIPEAQAAWPTFETNPVLIGSNVATAAQTTITAVKDISLDQIGFLIAKTMLSHILQSMVTWINSGFKGSPAFIQDLDRFLLNVADEAAGEFIQGLGDIGSFICSPFRLDIQLALSLKYQKARNNKSGRDLDTCTLSDIGDNIENFYSANFERENFWERWVKITSKPEKYTPYGQFMSAEAELNARLVNRKGQEIKIADMGDSFLSSKVCETVEGPTGSGSSLGGGLAGAAGTPAVGSSLGGGLGAPTVAPKQRCVVSTPGRVIADQINKTLGAGQDQLVAADEINEVISALLGQIANQALTGAAGLLGLSVGTGHTAGGYGAGSYVDELASQARSTQSSVLGQNYENAVEKIEIQQEYNELATEYIPKLKAVLDAPTIDPRFRGLNTEQIADLKARAQVSYDDAVTVKATTAKHIAYLTPLLEAFVKLQNELLLPNTTDERKRAIEIERAEIISKAASYSAYTETRLRESAREWRSIVG